jgi:uncharacterized phage protein (TIGR02220 family)
MELITFLKILKSKGNDYYDVWWKILFQLEQNPNIKLSRRLDISKTQYYRIIRFGIKTWENVIPNIPINFSNGNLSINSNFANKKQVVKPKTETSKNNEKNESAINMNEVYDSIISYLNSKANTNYQSTTKSYQSLINARFKSKFRIEDFYKVIDNKCAEWIGTDFQKFLRPETIFGNKFETYLNQQITKKTNQEIAYDKVSEATKLGWGSKN